MPRSPSSKRTVPFATRSRMPNGSRRRICSAVSPGEISLEVSNSTLIWNRPSFLNAVTSSRRQGPDDRTDPKSTGWCSIRPPQRYTWPTGRGPSIEDGRVGERTTLSGTFVRGCGAMVSLTPSRWLFRLDASRIHPFGFLARSRPFRYQMMGTMRLRLAKWRESRNPGSPGGARELTAVAATIRSGISGTFRIRGTRLHRPSDFQRDRQHFETLDSGRSPGG